MRVLTRDPDERVVPGNGVVAGPARPRRAAPLVRSSAPSARRRCALFTGESEGLPGVNVDRYGDFVVAQWLSAGALGWRDELYDAIEGALAPRGIYEQRRLRPLGGSAPPEPAGRVRGDEAPVELVVDDGACRFGVDVTAPLGVGLFLDMRLGWAAVAARAAERRVLEPLLVHGRVLRPCRQGRRLGGGRRRSGCQGARARAPQLRAVAASIRRSSRRSPTTW